MILTPGAPEIYHLWTGIERGLDQGWGAVSLPCPGSTEHIIAVWAGLCITAKSAADRRLWVKTRDYRSAPLSAASPLEAAITRTRRHSHFVPTRDSCTAANSISSLQRNRREACRRRHQPRRPPLANSRPGSPAPAMGPGTDAIGSPPDRKTVIVAPTFPPAPSQLINRLFPDTKAVIGVQGTQSGLFSTTPVTEPKELPDSTVNTGPLNGSGE